MNIKRLLPLLLLFIMTTASGQKRSLTHSDYDGWKNLGSSSITDNGNWIKYIVSPQEGDGWLYYYDVRSARLDSVARGTNASFSPGAEYLVYMVNPTFAETRKAKKDKKKADDMPKDNLGIKILSSGEEKMVERVKSYKVAEEGAAWMAYLMEKPLPEKKEKKEEGEKEEVAPAEPGARGARGAGGRPSAGGGSKTEGTELVITNPAANASFTFKDVTEFTVAKNGSVVGFVQVTSDSTKIDHYTVSVFNTKEQKEKEIFKGDGTVKKLTFDESGNNTAFIFTGDTSKVKIYKLLLSKGDGASEIVNCSTSGMIEGWSVSENGNLSFTDSGDMLLFGTADKPVEEPEDTLLAEEKYRLDIWSWHDQVLQPQQKVSLQRDRRATYTAIYHIGEGKMVQLADKDMPSVRVPMKGESTMAVGTSDLKYQMLSSWDANNYTDYYHVDLKTGARKLLIEGAPSSVEISPSGKYMVYWGIESKEWFVKPTAGGEARSLTAGLNVDFFDELHDSPSEPRPHGTAGWIEGEKYLLIYDSYDIWKMDITGKEKPVILTNGFGRKNNIRLRYNTLEGGGGGFGGRFGRGSDKLYIGEKEKIYLDAFHNYTKQAGLYTLQVNKISDPVKLDMGDYTYRSLVKAKENDMMIFQRGDYVSFPELYVSKSDLTGARKISCTNPQQSELNWGTVELVEWMSFDGQKLQGLLYKPEDFDASKKYPMIAYFYERSSDGLHGYMAPAPSASTINRTYAVSNGYLIFVPDIPYVEGYPGQSAYNAVVSGTYAMLDQFDFIDSDRLGLDGQSWGGYQIAYLITQTDLFACAFAGAPVSNMTSAYGGIRWGSGMSRMFQYEETQSRIGGTLWEKPLHYIENSPIFYVPKVNTPVMIMHNDADGAVPWYQGIEFFVALRRLGKPAWMVSYNDEDHNLTKRPNRMDLSIRKMQFFDHYLMSQPMPYWMEKGITQIEKANGVDGYDIMK